MGDKNEFMLLDEMPTSGQFVAVWYHNDQPYASVLRWNDGKRELYCEQDDSWGDDTAQFNFYIELNAKFIA